MDDDNDLARRATEGLIRDVAEEDGVSTKTIQRRLRAQGIGPIEKRVLTLTKEELEDLYVHQNKTTGEIATLCDVSQSTVYRALHRFEIPVRSDGRSRHAILNPDLVRLIRKSAQDNVPLTEIAKVTGVSKQAIHQVVTYQTWRDVA